MSEDFHNIVTADLICIKGIVLSELNIVSPDTITQSNTIPFFRLRNQASVIYELETINCDCRGLQFIDPLGLCLLKHWFAELQDRGVTVVLQNLPLFVESFLRRMDLFEGIDCVKFPDRSSGNSRNDLTGHLIEIQTLRAVSEIGDVATRIAGTIVHGMEVDDTPDPDGMHASEAEKLETTLEYVFSEILLNALDHGRKRDYEHAHTNIAAQYYPKSGLLKVAIVDNGCGLLETLQAHPKMEGELTDSKAISIALEPRVSCNRDAELGLDTRNQGIGLTVSTAMAFQAGGTCGIFTGSNWHSLSGNGVSVAEIPYWRGTGITFSFPKSGLGKVNNFGVARI
jgi:ABC-type transporter Mla MlaB component